jgi:hypothetical protein
MLGLVIPFTLIVILPTNKALLDPGLDRGSAEAAALLARWGRLHAVRSILSTVAFGVLACHLAWAGRLLSSAWCVDTRTVDFMVKDSKRFADSGGWGYGAFKYDAASASFTPATTADAPPQANDAKCGFGCHTIVKSRDYVFTEYGSR